MFYLQSQKYAKEAANKKEILAACLVHSYAGNMIFRNVGKLLPGSSTLHPSSQ
jgi:hypothetical protein